MYCQGLLYSFVTCNQTYYYREAAAPEAMDTGAEATRRASSSSSIDVDVYPEYNVDHDARKRTDVRRRLGRGDAPEN